MKLFDLLKKKNPTPGDMEQVLSDIDRDEKALKDDIEKTTKLIDEAYFELYAAGEGESPGKLEEHLRYLEKQQAGLAIARAKTVARKTESDRLQRQAQLLEINQQIEALKQERFEAIGRCRYHKMLLDRYAKMAEPWYAPGNRDFLLMTGDEQAEMAKEIDKVVEHRAPISQEINRLQELQKTLLNGTT